ncbi:ABC transporter ATP-binding protein [Parageobacillus thermoglucosidasius]|uniref:Nickel import system ATP-binding protein NikD n=1 Tax=Parageobacillus thermoglucosidasius TaxID=1426 RepID=A0AAN0YRM3_PARTM|nr:ABC transporter ATP-binding protein [Parageobacillus thermoglucosidasius]ALF09579.1 peptide ABC transporter ATP-binding protein [Parageobacillus thermoglucosidasius]ANZ32090.1 peptide ABC transporter ATP-binding protein [Parageobacillus thermoglucosidasius]APM82821.1 peptide ABC transporter ATP-binding protein [Parageobacillus thermoglucosidasius]KJX67980.1 peptide ABC transporter ATP-binding protein [Parageobacillus thermoglucosidasius]MBY6268121.1 ABC transporter ATP-binding protein [Para
MAILEVENLSVSFLRYTGMFKQQTIRVIEDLHLSINKGEMMAVVGASGSGKSLLAHAILGILPENAQMSGMIRYCGETLDPVKQAALRGREIAFVPQSVNSLDPLMRVGAQVRMTAKGKDPIAKQREVFQRYRLPENVERMYPFQLSGGMARKVLLATATVSDAQVIVADEPTSGMHADDVKEALQQLKELTNQGCAVLLITHDVEAALETAHRVAVFFAGTIVEIAPSADFSGDGERLRHPYSRALWSALPQNKFMPISGVQPHPNEVREGCLFAEHCPLTTIDCKNKRPEMRELREGMVRCHHAT